MDIIGSADPFFTANIDAKISYRLVKIISEIQSIWFYSSSILHDKLSPEWQDEEWCVRNVPLNAKLSVAVVDKDDDTFGDDDVIGHFEIDDLPNYKAPPEGHYIVGLFNRQNGRFHLTIESTISPESSLKLPRYTFDGPCRYTRHDCPSLIGHITMLNTDHDYSTWKIHIRQISTFFRPEDRQPWNRDYDVAQAIFGNTPRAMAKQHTFKLAHKMLYGSTIKHDHCGRLTDAKDLWKLIFFDEKTQRIRTCIYTYIIDDHTWRFGETGVAFFTDYASKHALHSNCADHVRYAGQFHAQPKYGWDRCDDEWELVFDNCSGTYAPSRDLLNNLKELLEFNFPGLNVVAYDHKNPLLEESMDALKLQEAKSKQNSTSSSLRQLVFNPSFSDQQ
jgi:hypothetical protein